MQEIARALGMRKGNLYYYFENKEAILFFCHDYSLDILLEHLARVEREQAAPDARLRQLIVGFIHMILDDLHGTALTMDLQALSPALFKAIVKKRDRFDRGLRAVIEDGMRKGVFRRGDPKLLTFAILGASNWITRWYDPSGPLHSDRIADAFADYLLAGLVIADVSAPARRPNSRPRARASGSGRSAARRRGTPARRPRAADAPRRPPSARSRRSRR